MRPRLERVATRVRQATAADAAAIARIHNQGIADRVATFETDERSAADVERALAERGSRYPTALEVVRRCNFESKRERSRP